MPVKKSKNNSYFQKQAEIELEMKELNENEGDNEVPEDIQIIAQEVKIVKSLACNNLAKRNKQIKILRKWLQIRTKSSFPFGQEDFMRIWKGLFYNMWYSDKPLVQEELAEQLCKLLECFESNLQYCMGFFEAFLKTMYIEWFGIDQWRIDKFLMLTRRMLRYMFKILKSFNWSLEAVELFNKHATEKVVFENVSAKGLTMHYFDIFFEELAKVSEGSITAEQVGIFVKPFIKFIATHTDFNMISHCQTRIFYHLLYQSSLGRDYTEKYNAWKNMGFPTKHINDLERVEDIEIDPDEKNTKHAGNRYLDPRAGNVDVFMPELPLDAESIIKEIEHFLHKEELAAKRRKLLKALMNSFETYQNGVFPLGIKTMPRFDKKSEKPLIKEKIRRLENLENELYGVDRKLKQMTKRKRRKFLKSLNFDDIDESNYEQSFEEALPKDYLLERRKRSQKSFMSGWLEEELMEEDLKPKRAKKETGANSNQTKINKLKLQNTESKESIEPGTELKTQEKSITDKPAKLHKKLTKHGVNLIKNKYEDNSSNELDVSKITEFQEQLTNPNKELKIYACEEERTPNPKNKTLNEWDEPLRDGEIEYILPSRKVYLKKANANLVLNPLAKQRLTDNQYSLPSSKIKSFSAANSPKTPNSTKRVKIALKHNTSQNPLEYIQQIRSSPNIPFDAKRKPGKGLLKPNAMPSPINPFYKNKIGLKLLNDTI